MLEYFIQKDFQTILVHLHKHNKKAFLEMRKAFINVGWEMGFEPTIFGTTIRRFNQLSYTHHISNTPLRCYIINTLPYAEAGELCRLLFSGTAHQPINEAVQRKLYGFGSNWRVLLDSNQWLTA